ncbi:MAG: hypothetical protein IPK34_01030 [Ramlibacter sp.]|jgi:hypothetical protein|nr:hypothetical protein [Ramlibacter sp.]
MTDAPTLPAPGESLPVGRFSGRNAFQQGVRDALACAARDGWKTMVLSDPSFEDWPLGERAVAESLQAWSASGRQMILLACRYDAVLRKHARFVTWRRQWSHIIECWQCPAADPLDFPSAIWSPAWCLQRLDPVRSTGHAGTEPERRLMLREALTEWQGKCSPGFPATTLGL